MIAYPKTTREAVHRTERKLKALRRQTDEMLYGIASIWDDGIVTGSVDNAIRDLEASIEGIEEAVKEQVQLWQEDGYSPYG